MKIKSVPSFIYLFSPLLLTSQIAFAHVFAIEDEATMPYEPIHGGAVTVPVLEGGFSATIGALYLVPTSDNQSYGVNVTPDALSVLNFDTDYEFGLDVVLGYIFPETANAIELFYRELSTSDDATHTVLIDDEIEESLHGDISYDLNAVDLMISQFIDVGHFMQMRFLGGLSYLDLSQNKKVHRHDDEVNIKNDSDFNGLGLRVGVDGRYDFGSGFGIVGGGSAAYYMGELDISGHSDDVALEDNRDNHTVANFRANLGIDYVFFMGNEAEEHSTLGFELGYLFDYYNDAAGDIAADGLNLDTFAVSFNGPYFNLKGIF